MINLDARQIESVFTWNEIIDIVRSAIIKHHHGAYEVPQRLHLGDDKCTYLVMPVMGQDYYCTKLVSVVPNNKNQGLPIINGTVILHLRKTGRCVAMLDAAMITALRTAAVGAIALDVISKDSIGQLGVIGCGIQGTWQTIFATSIREIRAVYCYSRSKATFENYKNRVGRYCPDLNIIKCQTADEVVRHAEVIYTCTNAKHPVFSNQLDLVRDRDFISIGSYRKDMQELPDVVYEVADMLLIDTETAMDEAGDVINSIKNMLMRVDQVLTLGAVLTNPKLVESVNSIVFKSVGTALFDLALSEAIYRNMES